MFNKEFGFLEKRFVFFNPETPSGSSENKSNDFSTLKNHVELELANEHPFEFLKAHPTVNGEASPAQILALRLVFEQLTSPDGESQPESIDISEIYSDSFDLNNEETTSRLESGLGPETIGWLDLCIIKLRLMLGQELDADALVIDTDLIQTVVDFTEQDPLAFKPNSVVEAYFEQKETSQESLSEILMDEESEKSFQNKEDEERRIQENQRAAFVAWRVKNALPRR